MLNKKRELNIFLADLTHTGIRIGTESFPLNIGLIASYALKKFGSDIQVKLFKYPDRLLYSLQNEKYDILACSTYIWNNNLSEWACEMAKKYNPDVITVRGGWNFPLEDKQQEEYLHKHKFTDIFCMHEGEVAFANVIERLLSVENIKQWNDRPLDGCVFLNSKNDMSLTKCHIIHRISNLDGIPSPYITGLLDEFFDGNLTPMIETTRGCPFKCNYCNNSNSYYNKVNFFSTDYVIEEINYIAKRIDSTGISNLTIADTNFGMYPRDKDIALALKKTQDKYKWPLGIMTSTGKNNVDIIINATEVLGNSLIISMSVQSMNKDTLINITRDNINLNMYKEISDSLIKRGRSPMAEVIVPLPGETYSTYIKGVEELINIGAKKIVSYTLQLNNGTVYKNEDYRKQFGYKGKYRLIPYDFGIYNGRKVFDYEEVATFTDLLSFDDYLNIRKFALIMELLFNNGIFNELFKILSEKGISNYSFMKYTLDKLGNASTDVIKVFDSFISETKSELKDNEDALIRFYSTDENYERLKAGEIGGNVIFKHKGIMLGKHMGVWIDYIFDCAADILKFRNNNERMEEIIQELNSIKIFVSSKLKDLFIPEKTSEDIIQDFKYDILAWLENGQNIPLKDFKIDSTFKFYYDETQKTERFDLFGRYGTGFPGLAKIMARVPAIERMFRKIEEITDKR